MTKDLPSGDIVFFNGSGDAVEGYSAQRVKEILEAALKDCRNATLEEAAKATDKLANDKKATQPQQFALDIASDKIRELKS
jgi:polyribonucleotide nucleotidyltransferase